MKIGTVLRNLRESAGATLEAVALEAGTDVGNLSRIERGVQKPSIDVVEQIASALRIRMSALYLLVENEASDASSCLSKDEMRIIREWNGLSSNNQELLLEFIKVIKRQQEQ